MGSFIMSTSVTVPNMPKYSLSLSLDVCQLSPPTNNLPGAGSPLLGVLRPEEPEWLPPFIVGTKPPCSSWSKRPLPSKAAPLQNTKKSISIFLLAAHSFSGNHRRGYGRSWGLFHLLLFYEK